MIQQYEDFERSIFNKGLEVLHMHVKESALWSFFDWEEGFGNGLYDYNPENQEDFIDVDGNCYWSKGEPYLDSGNEEYDEGESFTDIGNGEWDFGEVFTDMNGNGVYDSSQKVLVSGLNSIDFNPEGQIIAYEWEEITGFLSSDDIETVDNLSSTGGIISFLKPDFGNAETFTDQNENGIWDRLEPFEDLNGNSLCDGDYGNIKFTLKIQISRVKSTWHYANSQNKGISLKPIHFIDRIKLIPLP